MSLETFDLLTMADVLPRCCAAHERTSAKRWRDECRVVLQFRRCRSADGSLCAVNRFENGLRRTKKRWRMLR